MIHPGLFAGVPLPFYREVTVCRPPLGKLLARVREFRPDHLHISTEGPIGWAVRHLALRRGWKFTTAYHTRFPEYARDMIGVPASWGYRVVRHFHRPSSGVMVATPSLEAELRGRNFIAPLRRWSRGVDLSLFRPRPGEELGFPRPILLYAGRVSKEKGVEEFLKLSTPGTKVVVGDGPIRASLERNYPDAEFLGYRRGEELAKVYASADLFVFPSKTDTFGLVMIEAMASGLPVAAHPVVGPIDIVTRPGVGALHDDLGEAIRRALAAGRREECVAHASGFSWDRCTGQFLGNLVASGLN